MENKDFFLIMFPILTAILSSYLTYYFTIKSKQKETILKFKEEKYTNLIIALQGFVGSTASTERKKIFFEEHYKSWLYSSDGVIKNINILFESLEYGKVPDINNGKEIIGNIVLEMRKDLLGKTSLKNIDFRYVEVVEPENKF